MFDALGFGVPTGAITVKTGTVIAAFLVGMGVTFLATVFPAIRASRVPPLAALRDVAVEKTSVSRVRLALGVLFTLVGVALVIAAGAGGGGIALAGLGAVFTIVGVVVLGPIAAPTGRVRPRPADRPLAQDDRSPRARQRDAQPAPYCRHRVGA